MESNANAYYELLAATVELFNERIKYDEIAEGDDYSDALHEVVDGNVPHYYHEIFTVMAADGIDIEFEDAGLGEYFCADALCLVEWPSKAGAYLPPADLVLRFDFSDTGRVLELRAASESGCQCLNQLCCQNAAS